MDRARREEKTRVHRETEEGVEKGGRKEADAEVMPEREKRRVRREVRRIVERQGKRRIDPLWPSVVATIHRGTRPRSPRTDVETRGDSFLCCFRTKRGVEQRGDRGGSKGFAKSGRDADGGRCSGGFTCIGPAEGTRHSSY